MKPTCNKRNKGERERERKECRKTLTKNNQSKNSQKKIKNNQSKSLPFPTLLLFIYSIITIQCTRDN